MALRFAGLGSVVERSATKAAIAQASLSAARRGARSNVDHIAPEVAAAYTLRMTRTRVVFRCDQNIMRAMRRGRAGARGGLWRHKCLGLRMPLAVLRAGTRYEVRGPMTAVLWASGVVQGVGLAKTLRGRSAALSRELADLELLAEPRWRVSRRRWRPKSVCRRRSSPSPLRGALQIDCANGTKQLRGRGNRCGISALGSGGCAAGRG